MFQAHAALFLYATSPVHMGAGQAFGLIDNPIVRERHCEHPVFPGSGLKGAIRHRFHALPGWIEGEKGEKLLDRLFGPESRPEDRGGKDLHAGAISLGDAQLVAFPVRCVKQGYVYATSAHALARAARLLAQLGIQDVPAVPAALAAGACCAVNPALLSNNTLHLEAFEYDHTRAQEDRLKAFARWLADHALPAGEAHDYFRDKFARDLVLLADEDFTWFAKNATVVEPHVRINNKTGAADDGGLFYTENLPPETLMLGSVMASRERSGKADLEAEAVLQHVTQAIDGQLLQIGGDATTGRGLVAARIIQGSSR
ncbi:type III-B CRISPR module RAMP protein Cmr4 [Zoogloeaceae bacteirum Par-f-2]|jgi:CRISPR-associated protein Cmr4|nr:type III-B CRISPR module RAMP protein Cmr4 [Rhodocyclaceae bacterium]AVZ79422.1 type III-B CRISPR module RAMP protein Cmr4 [Zoogloeaceae bacteirum Par-f-2]